VETRYTEPWCSGGGHEGKGESGPLAVLSGCQAVAVARIGPGAREMLESNGIKVIAGGGLIDEVLRGIAKDLTS